MLIVFTIFLRPAGRVKPKELLVWACVFLGAGFGLVEYAVWVGGENLFALVFSPNIPLLASFAVWFAFLIWLFEKHGERRLWIALLAALLAVTALAMACMDCLRF